MGPSELRPALAPAVILAAAALAVWGGPSLPASLSGLRTLGPYAVLALGVALALRFNRGRALILLGSLLYTLKIWDAHRAMEDVAKNRAAVTANALSRPAPDKPIDTMDVLGRSLFGDYLFAVELGGTVLLIAAIGAIAIAPRRAEGTL